MPRSPRPKGCLDPLPASHASHRRRTGHGRRLPRIESAPITMARHILLYGPASYAPCSWGRGPAPPRRAPAASRWVGRGCLQRVFGEPERGWRPLVLAHGRPPTVHGEACNVAARLAFTQPQPQPQPTQRRASAAPAVGPTRAGQKPHAPDLVARSTVSGQARVGATGLSRTI